MARFAWFSLALLLLVIAGCDDTSVGTPVERGETLYRAGKWDEAIEACNEAIRLNPADSAAYIWRGRSYHARGDLQKAIDDFSAAIRLYPQDSEPYYLRALAYKDQGQQKLAQADETRARELDPAYARAYLFTPEAESEPLPRSTAKPAEVAPKKPEPLTPAPLTAAVPEAEPEKSDPLASLTTPKVEEEPAKAVPAEPTDNRTETEKLLEKALPKLAAEQPASEPEFQIDGFNVRIRQPSLLPDNQGLVNEPLANQPLVREPLRGAAPQDRTAQPQAQRRQRTISTALPRSTTEPGLAEAPSNGAGRSRTIISPPFPVRKPRPTGLLPEPEFQQLPETPAARSYFPIVPEPRIDDFRY